MDRFILAARQEPMTFKLKHKRYLNPEPLTLNSEP
jgi:hypothetical protein